MAYIAKIPQLNLEMQEGTIVKWHVEEGDEVSEGDPLAEVEAEKANDEISAKEDGVVRDIYVREGQAGEPGDAIAIVAPGDEDISSLVAEATDGPSVTEEPDTPSGSAAGDGDERTTDEQDDQSGTERKVTPKAKKRAAELGVDISTVAGTGYEGAVTAEDVEQADAEREQAASKPHTFADEKQLVGMRKTMSERLGESYRDAIHVTVHREMNVSALLGAVEEAEETLDVDVSLVDLFLRALSETLDQHPEFNGTFEDGTHRLVDEHHVAFAVDVDDGLVTPVIPHLDEKSLPEISTTRTELTEQVMDGEYSSQLLSGGTFTITNLGPFSADSFTPIINPPQVAILGLNRYKDRPISTSGGVEFEPHMTFDLTFDHRIVDGADAARFLETLNAELQRIERHLPDTV